MSITNESPIELNRSTLAEWLNEARAQADEAALPPNLLDRLVAVARPRRTLRRLRLPSGLDVTEAAELAGALARATETLQQTGQSLPADLRLSEVELNQGETDGNGWQVSFKRLLPGLNSESQPALARLLYALATGRERSPGEGIPGELSQQFPETARVLERSGRDTYSSVSQLAGAFGWSLYQQEQLFQNPPRPSRRSPDKAPAQPKAEVQTETTEPGLSASTRLSLSAWVSIGVALVLLLGFVLYAAFDLGDPTRPAQSTVQAGPGTPTSPISGSPGPTTPAQAVQILPQNDGSTLTRFNPAYGDPAETNYKLPGDMPPGSISLVNTSRPLQLAAMQWSLGQNIYLSLADGGWESWDLGSGKRISRRELPQPDQYVWSSYAPDGENWAAVGLDGQLRLGHGGRVLRTAPYAATSTSNLNSYNWQSSNIRAFSWSPNNTYLCVTLPDNTCQLWSYEDGPHEIKLDSTTNTDPISFANIDNSDPFSQQRNVIWSADSQFIGRYVSKTTFQIFETRTLNSVMLTNLSDPADKNSYLDNNTSNGPLDYALSGDNRYLALVRWTLTPSTSTPNSNPRIGAKANLSIWELPSFTTTDNRAARQPGLNSPGATFGSSGLTPAPSGTGTTSPLKARRVQSIELTDLTIGNAWLSAVTMEWSRDGRLAVAGRLAQPGKAATDSDFYFYNAPRQTQVTVFDPTPAKEEWTPGAHWTLPQTAALTYMHWSPEGRRLLFNNSQNALLLYRLADEGTTTPPALQTLQAGGQGQPELLGRGLLFSSPDGKLAIGYDSSLKVVVQDSRTGATVSELPQVAGRAFDRLIWSPDGRYLAASYVYPIRPTSSSPPQPVIRVWQLENGQSKVVGDLVIPANEQGAGNFSWTLASQNPAILFEASASEVGRWDITKPLPPLEEQLKNPSSTPPLFEIIGHVTAPQRRSNGNFNNGTVWLPDWSGIITSDGSYGGSYGLYKLKPGPADKGKQEEVQGVLFDPNPGKDGISFSEGFSIVASPDNKLVAFGQSNGLVNIYETNSGKLIKAFTAHQGRLYSLAFSPDGQSLLTSGGDRTVKIWETSTWRMTQILRSQFQGYLSAIWLSDNRTVQVTYSGGFSSGYSTTQFFWRVK